MELQLALNGRVRSVVEGVTRKWFDLRSCRHFEGVLELVRWPRLRNLRTFEMLSIPIYLTQHPYSFGDFSYRNAFMATDVEGTDGLT